MRSKEEIFAIVRQQLCEALAVDEEEVTPEATIMGDLNAESIDFIDILFRLEKQFDIKIPRDDLVPDAVFSDESFVKDGKMTEAGLAELRKRMPFANLDTFSQNPVVKDFQNLFTVQTICDFVAHKLANPS